MKKNLSRLPKRRFPIGAEIIDGKVHFRVWAPKRKQVEVHFQDHEPELLKKEKEGYFSGWAEVQKNSLYQFKLDDEKRLFADPASRFQPDGPFGPSQIIDPSEFKWADGKWKGVKSKGHIIYEIHIGTFTEEGTYLGALKKIPYLKEVGITLIELMPVNEFPGKFNWGYDGVNLFAPTHNYGTPDDLRTLINTAHKHGIGVILDVVYNHFGPEGNFISEFSDDYFTHKNNEWGLEINFGNVETRKFFIANAGYWIEEFHFDGLRIDACHAIIDKSEPHILTEITDMVREKGKGKDTFVTAENEKQEIQFIQHRDEGGFGLDAVWNEDFHHAASVRLTGHNEAYFNDYLGRVQEFISLVKYGFLYQGQWYRWQSQNRGEQALGFPPYRFINFLENHDQIANVRGGSRLIQNASLGNYKAMATLLLLAPQTPLLFQGQEFGSTSPFYYFSDFSPELAHKVFQGRKKFISQFKSAQLKEVYELIPPSFDVTTFQKSKLDWSEQKKNSYLFDFYKDLIWLRKIDPLFNQSHEIFIDGSVLSEDAFLLRFFSEIEERLLIINFGVDFFFDPAPEPLFAPPINSHWEMIFSTESVRYGGHGYPTIPKMGNWTLFGQSAMLLKAAFYG